MNSVIERRKFEMDLFGKYAVFTNENKPQMNAVDKCNKERRHSMNDNNKLIKHTITMIKCI